MRSFLLLSFLLHACHSTAQLQPGCTDPQAMNYDVAATVNDGSCRYPATNYELTTIAELPDELREASGIVLVDTLAWVITDAADTNRLYALDPRTGLLLRSVVVRNANNRDWEEIAQDAAQLYIGDFGNNYGDRRDLTIYKVRKADLRADTAMAEVIRFAYADQIDFPNQPVNQTNYDCEAFFFWNDSLHLFTKHWLDERTRHYVLPATPGEHLAELRGEFDAGGLITAADVDNTGLISLLGYNRAGINFIWMLHEYPGQEFFAGNRRRIELGTGITNGQTEGLGFIHSCFQPAICAAADTRPGYIVSEEVELGPFKLPPQLLAFDLGTFFSPIAATTGVAAPPRWTIGPNPFNDTLLIRSTEGTEAADFSLFDPFGRMVLRSERQSELLWNTTSLPPGFYLLRIRQGERQEVLKLIKP